MRAQIGLVRRMFMTLTRSHTNQPSEHGKKNNICCHALASMHTPLISSVRTRRFRMSELLCGIYRPQAGIVIGQTRPTALTPSRGAQCCFPNIIKSLVARLGSRLAARPCKCFLIVNYLWNVFVCQPVRACACCGEVFARALARLGYDERAVRVCN